VWSLDLSLVWNICFLSCFFDDFWTNGIICGFITVAIVLLFYCGIPEPYCFVVMVAGRDLVMHELKVVGLGDMIQLITSFSLLFIQIAVCFGQGEQSKNIFL